VVVTPLLPTLVSSLHTPVVEGIIEDTMAVEAKGVDAVEAKVAVMEASWTLNAVSKDKQSSRGFWMSPTKEIFLRSRLFSFLCGFSSGHYIAR
jgi:hypothetical protein